ncbi:VanZ family protein [Micromonospora sp. DT47]|uniref:VanZ family protein n=1 Tax=Micromonospora sp. DT47 TaxID=3393431 RepID=UPI003CF5ADB8
MGQVWRDWGGVLLATVAAVPVTALVVAVLARCRRDAATPAEAWRRSVAEVGAVAGTVPWVWMILTPRAAPGEVKLVPLRDLADLIAAGPASTVLVQVGGNLLVFAALGLFAPVRFAALAGVGRLFLLGAAASALVETLQYALDLGRVASVDDVLLNATGAALAGLLSRPWWAGRRSVPVPPVAVPATPPR